MGRGEGPTDPTRERAFTSKLKSVRILGKIFRETFLRVAVSNMLVGNKSIRNKLATTDIIYVRCTLYSRELDSEYTFIITALILQGFCDS